MSYIWLFGRPEPDVYSLAICAEVSPAQKIIRRAVRISFICFISVIVSVCVAKI